MSVAAAEALSPTAGEKPRGPEDPQTDDPRWRPALGLPCQLTVDLPLPNFKVADFLKLQAGSVVGTEWKVTRDVPLRVNGTLIGWGEFEGAGGRLAVRLTELA